jgi:exosome complex component RRP42
MPLSKSEQSYIKSAILLKPPQRSDGRKLQEFRPIALRTGGDVAPLANGSAHLKLGGSEVMAAIRLEVESVRHSGISGDDESQGRDGGRVVCSVNWLDSPSALIM